MVVVSKGWEGSEIGIVAYWVEFQFYNSKRVVEMVVQPCE
jgi:hypothetical protein